MIAGTKELSSFATTSSLLVTGVYSRVSSVPLSFSPTTELAAIMEDTRTGMIMKKGRNV